MVVVLFHYYLPDYHQTKVDVVQMKQQMDFLNDNVDDVEQMQLLLLQPKINKL
jgi:hypothetical protein